MKNNYYQTDKEYYQKKNRIPKRILALAIVGLLGLEGYVLIKEAKSNKTKIVYPTMPPYHTANPVPSTEVVTPVPTPYVSYDDGFNRGDSIISNSDVNMRLDTTIKSSKLGSLPAGSLADRILSEGEWDLVRYEDQIGFVHSDFTDKNPVDCYREYYRVYDYNDVVRATTGLNLRLGPSTKEDKVFEMNKNEKAEVFGMAIPFDNPDDIWYLVKARGQIGFICAKYTIKADTQNQNKSNQK